MPVNLFIQDINGDHNLNAGFGSQSRAEDAVERFMKAGGYWYVKADDEGKIEERAFIPWHRVEFCRIEEVEKEEEE